MLNRVLFDRQDYELIDVVEEVLEQSKSLGYLKELFDPHLHPNGIKELAAPKELRIAYAVIHLLDSLEMGKVEDRIRSLRALMEEVLNTRSNSLRRNTARVLLSIMKEIVRTRHNPRRQLELAHDFRMATYGRPRFIRQQLRHYHLLEMPEEWNQVAFDEHVHDANTKGRKSATHLIMDAWIKGIRDLTVIYYNYVKPEVAAELLEAAGIMDIRVQIGVEFTACLRGRYVRLIWVPRGFSGARDFKNFLADAAVASLMKQGREVSDYEQRHVLAVLHRFNSQYRQPLNAAFGLDLPALDPVEFLAFVGSGQASILHLSKYIHTRLLPLMQERVKVLRQAYAGGTAEERQRIQEMVDEMNGLDSENIAQRFLRQARDGDGGCGAAPLAGEGLPELMTCSPRALLERLNRIHSGSRFTLNLSGLQIEDVLELLYDGGGHITHLEIFNLKDHTTGKTAAIPAINQLQRAINDGNVVALKKIIRSIIQRLAEGGPAPGRDELVTMLSRILNDIPTLQGYYRETPLKAVMGSDSSGGSRYLHGMGMAVYETLPLRVQRELRRSPDPSRQILPVFLEVCRQVTYLPRRGAGRLADVFFRTIRPIPILGRMGFERRSDWVRPENALSMTAAGNVVTLGGVQRSTNELSLTPSSVGRSPRISWQYLNTTLKNLLKVIFGFIPAFLTFCLTKEWWLLAYFGAVIWFAITGLRNILQSVLGGGGIRRSPLLRWKSYVSWNRICDSLLYTGFSVPLLDYVVKTVILDRLAGVTTETNPVMLYAVMGLANGCYISGHNILRGLSKGAVMGNFFRSILSIPLAVAFNTAVGGVLSAAGVLHFQDVLQKWAAVISKAASDCVAGVIEGLADRHENMLRRFRDYTAKLRQMFDIYAQLELLLPSSDVLELLETPDELVEALDDKASALEIILILNSLDLLYLWMYQPRGRICLKGIMRQVSPEERRVIIRLQAVLLQYRNISKLFVDGIVGKKFSRALSFYLNRYEEYLNGLDRLDAAIARREARGPKKGTAWSAWPAASLRFEKEHNGDGELKGVMASGGAGKILRLPLEESHTAPVRISSGK